MIGSYKRVSSKLSSFIQYFIEESFSMVFFVIGISILASACFMMLLTSCSGKVDKKNEMRMLAVENLKMTVEHPESLQIIAFSEIDSVYGKNFFKNEEVIQILDNISDFNTRLFNDPVKSAKDFDDPAMSAKIQRGIGLSDVFEKMINSNDSETNEFSGWKMKVLYQYQNSFNDTLKNEKYFIFDKSQNHIIHFFDIPIL